MSVQVFPQVMASVNAFKSATIRIRDILRSVSITGMDSMRHICLYLMSRFMTREMAAKLGVPDNFCWEYTMELIRTQGMTGVQFARDNFYNENAQETLLDHFDRLFQTDRFSFEVRQLETHKEILEILDTINIQDVDCHMDMLGWVFEQHLKTGSSAARDLGQFFTPRDVCEYMVGLCKPAFKAGGCVPESVCDPSMGTGGFLTSCVKYFRKTYPDQPIDWDAHHIQIHGCDTDARVASIARMNMFMETRGSCFLNTQKHNSLYGGLTFTGYDVILANMPFGLKGLQHAKCCERVKALKIRGTKSEPLFLQLMMASLNLGGRCAVIVPDGVLVNNSLCHNETRKYLLENFELKKVIRIIGKVFMNTGIQPSILFFENTGSPTTSTEFWEVMRDSASAALVENLVKTITMDQLDGTYALDIRRYHQSEQLALRVGYTLSPLGEVCTHVNGKTLSHQDKEDGGVYNVMGGGTQYIGTFKDFNRDGYNVSISKSGASAGFVKQHTGKFWAGDCFTVHSKNEQILTNRYLYYYLKYMCDLKQRQVGMIPHCKWDDIQDLVVCIPPLDRQQEIVVALDNLSKIANDTTQMISQLNAVMQSVMQSIVQIPFHKSPLQEVLDVVSGKANTNRFPGNPVPYYDSNGPIGYVQEALYSGEYTVTARNLSIGAVHYVDFPYYPSDHTINFTSKDRGVLNNKYFYYWLRFNNHLLKQLSSGIKPGIRKSDVEKIMMPVPDMQFQLTVIDKMEKMSNQISTLEKVKEEAVDNAKFILDMYLIGCRKDICL